MSSKQRIPQPLFCVLKSCSRTCSPCCTNRFVHMFGSHWQRLLHSYTLGGGRKKISQDTTTRASIRPKDLLQFLRYHCLLGND